MRLINNLRAVETGNRRHIVEPLHTIRYTSERDVEHSPKFAREYSIIVTIGANQWIDEDIAKASEGRAIQHAVQHMKHAIVEHVYGELRRDLFDLQMEMRNEMNYYDSHSQQKLMKIIEKITL